MGCCAVSWRRRAGRRSSPLSTRRAQSLKSRESSSRSSARRLKPKWLSCSPSMRASARPSFSRRPGYVPNKPPPWRTTACAWKPSTDRARRYTTASTSCASAREGLSCRRGRRTTVARVLIGAARLYDEGFDSSEVALLEAVTESVGHGLERAWLAAGRDQYAARQTALVRAAKALNASLLTADVLQTLCKEISDALRADVVAVYFADENGVIRAVAGLGVPDEALGGEQPVDSLCASVIRTGSPQVLQPRRSDREVALGLRGVTGIRCALAVPARRAEVDGALLVGFAAERSIVDSDIELVAGFAELAGIAYRNADEHTAVRRAATLDSLTGCLNHGAFHGRLREEIARAERTSGRLALISIDFDDFKSVNDRFGHLAGDELLRTLADVLRDAVRSYDQVGRLGGDEFMLLLPATEAESARGDPGPSPCVPRRSPASRWRGGHDQRGSSRLEARRRCQSSHRASRSLAVRGEGGAPEASEARRA